MRALRILHVASEVAPFAKTGGLADVVAGLGAQLARAGHDVRVLLPDYGSVVPRSLPRHPIGEAHCVDVGGAPVDWRCSRLGGPHGPAMTCFVECEEFYATGGIYGTGERDAQRFLLLCRAAMQLCHDLDWAPDVLHCHDWHTALLPLLVRADRHFSRLFRATHTVLTLHNIGYQGAYPARVLDEAGFGAVHESAVDPADPESVNLLRAGIRHADALTTVSPTHAREIRTPAFGMGLEGELQRRSHRLVGILNGADYAHWDPRHDPLIASAFGPDDLAGKAACRSALRHELALDLDPAAPIIGMVSRLVDQKGIDLVLEALPPLLADRPIGLAALGDGEARYVAALDRLAAQFPGRVSFTAGHDEGLAHRITAGSDLFLVPSRYEPCGLTQMYAMRYATVPVVRRTGGLADTVTHFDPATGRGTGSMFLHADAQGLRWALSTALEWYRDPDAWRQVQANAMAADFSWERQAAEYQALYERLADG